MRSAFWALASEQGTITMIWSGIMRERAPFQLRVHIAWRRNSGRRDLDLSSRTLGHSYGTREPSENLLFAWKCVHDALPTKVNLRKRGVVISQGCDVCAADYENLLHVLFFCSFSRLVWAIAGIPWRSLQCSSTKLEDWFRGVHRELDRVDWDYFLAICWALWWARNRRMFEGKELEASEVIRLAARFSGKQGISGRVE
ncbi:UNVERIFIED_CONTAM: hypothetical protein Sradi_2035500 [Sesamum radiatum]|uniref:Reverse transcriptase zinc-binding domain-containing protein n=1 Tax=Sesamum radiatum TaxID=300843 RepID=A0AAW2THA8_SESRA